MPGHIVKNRSKVKSKLLPTKPSVKSKILKKSILCLLPGGNNSVDKSKILSELIRNIFTGDDVGIRDHYSALVTYLVLNCKEVSYDNFVGSYESVKLSHSSQHGVCCALPYGALISSGIILKWESEQQNQVVLKMLKIYKNEPESMNVVFHFLIGLDSSIKLSSHIFKKICIDSPIQLYFMLSVDSKQGDATVECTMFTSESIVNLVDILLKEPDDQELYKKISALLAKKLLTLGKEILMKFWEKLMMSYNNPRTDYKELVVLQLLSSLLEKSDDSHGDLMIAHLFTSSVIKILSKSSPKIEPVFKAINSSLRNLSQNFKGDEKLIIIDAILTNTEKYLEKSMVVKICDTLVSTMTFEEISHVADMYCKVIMGEKLKTKQKKKDNEFNDYEKIYCIRFFGKLISLNSCKYQTDWRKTQLKFLFKIGFLSEYKELIAPHVAGHSRKIFYSCLNQKFPKLTDLDSILKKLVKFAGEKMNNKEENFVVPIKDNAYNLWFKTLNVLKKLKDTQNEDAIVFKVLLRYMMLFMFSNYQVSKSTLDELFKVIENKEMNCDELHWTEVTVDMFLHLLSGNDNTHKNVIHSTFGYVCKHMTLDGLNLILSSIKDKDNDNDQSDDENSEVSNDEGSISDAEESEENSKENDSDNEEEEESDECNEENEGQIDKLKDALRQELFKIDTASTCGSVDIDDIEEAEGKLLNSTLGDIFKEQHNKYTSSTKNKIDNLEIHFRIRAVNLLEIYIENNPSLYSCTIILSNIISLLKTSIPNHILAPFSVCLKRSLKKLTDLKEFSTTDRVSETYLCAILNQILVRDCSTSVYQDMTEQIVDCCLFLIRSCPFVSKSGAEMSESLKLIVNEFFKNPENHIPFLLFTSIFSLLSLQKLIPLVSDVVKIAFSNNIKYHKRTQALQILITFFNNNRLFKDVSGFEKSLIQIEDKILKNSLKSISDITNYSEINKKYGCMFLDLLSLMKTKNKCLTNEPGPHWDTVADIINKLSKIPTFQMELKISFVNFCKIFNLEIPKVESSVNSSKETKKRKSDVNINGHMVKPTKKKRKSRKMSS